MEQKFLELHVQLLNGRIQQPGARSMRCQNYRRTLPTPLRNVIRLKAYAI